MTDLHASIAWLRSTRAVRERCRMLFDAALRGELEHVQLDLDRLDAAAEYVTRVIRDSYPALDIPYHSRWRHFAVGHDRWARVAAKIGDVSARARAAADLAVVSVLLDAGAGARWRYVEPGVGGEVARSEGLAVASLHLFQDGVFSSDSRHCLRVDADALQALTEARLAEGFQVRPDNPLVGLDSRAELLRRLGTALQARPDIFGAPARPGGLVDHLTRGGRETRVKAHDLLVLLLDALGPIWPSGLVVEGVNLGDVARHRLARGEGATDGLVPFHKLSQWLAYSLIEPLEWAGAAVAGLGDLTGLPEYRNGGLFVDAGVIVPQGLLARGKALDPRSEPVVEWRALTVVLLDEIAPRVRRLLGLDAAALPLAKVLQGGTWTAGRKIAREKRPDGAPPIDVMTDGTTF
ncbi:MAG: URC4/urg3 family protein [Alphaproteobacteria bacterium]|nr:URC4/urg3 family protein [Alphaproteobacteria bacterium]